MARDAGTVKWFNDAKGYGFIVPNNGGSDVFVHISALQQGQKLQDGQKVSYDLAPDRRGRMTAIDIELQK